MRNLNADLARGCRHDCGVLKLKNCTCTGTNEPQPFAQTTRSNNKQQYQSDQMNTTYDQLTKKSVARFVLCPIGNSIFGGPISTKFCSHNFADLMLGVQKKKQFLGKRQKNCPNRADRDTRLSRTAPSAIGCSFGLQTHAPFFVKCFITIYSNLLP